MPRTLSPCSPRSSSPSPPPRHAARTCAGTIRTGLLHPLPRPLTITASRGLQDTANPGLTQSFVDGLRRAGQQPGKRGNVSLASARK